jgi:pimeloyl-ACP methyl ester carboxylesterase
MGRSATIGPQISSPRPTRSGAPSRYVFRLAAFSAASAECFARGSDGLIRDSELLYRRWAFDVTTIERRVHMWQGLDDRLVPDSINKTVANRMPGAVWHAVEGAGHFVAVGSADEIFGIAAEELGA